MARLILVLVLSAGLICLAIWEQHIIQQSYDRIESDIVTMIATIQGQEEIDTDENINKINYMFDYWVKSERRLSMLARHFDLSQVSMNLIYAKNFIQFNNKEEATVGLLQTLYLVQTHSYNVGTSFQNVI